MKAEDTYVLLLEHIAIKYTWEKIYNIITLGKEE